MKTLLCAAAALFRLFRPTRGVHASPAGYLRELAAELLNHRPDDETDRRESAPSVFVPAPRPPNDSPPPPTPARPAADDGPSLVRPYFLAHEQRVAEQYSKLTWLRPCTRPTGIFDAYVTGAA